MVFCRSNRGWAHLVRCTPGILVYGEYFVDNPKVHNHLYLMTEVHPTLARRIDIRCLNWWLRSSGRWDLALYVLRLSGSWMISSVPCNVAPMTYEVYLLQIQAHQLSGLTILCDSHLRVISNRSFKTRDVDR